MQISRSKHIIKGRHLERAGQRIIEPGREKARCSESKHSAFPLWQGSTRTKHHIHWSGVVLRLGDEHCRERCSDEASSPPRRSRTSEFAGYADEGVERELALDGPAQQCANRRGTVISSLLAKGQHPGLGRSRGGTRKQLHQLSGDNRTLSLAAANYAYRMGIAGVTSREELGIYRC